MNKMSLAWMKCDNVQFRFIATLGTRSNFDVPPDKIAPELVPFGDKLF